MKKILIMLFLLNNPIYADIATLLFYPSYKFAELSGGYPARMDTEATYDNDKKLYFISLNEHIQEIKINKSHSSYCPCENGKIMLDKCPEIKLPINKVFLFVNGHLQEISFIPHE